MSSGERGNLPRTCPWSGFSSTKPIPSPMAAALILACRSRSPWAAAAGVAIRLTENLNYKHFINITHLVTSVDEDKPEEAELFGEYWEKYGQ